MKPLIIILIIWNLITFFMMGIDKHRAKVDKSRISEKTLLICTFAMGGLGTTIGAVVFNHKIRKLKFKILLPFGVIVNCAALYGLSLLNLL